MIKKYGIITVIVFTVVAGVESILTSTLSTYGIEQNGENVVAVCGVISGIILISIGFCLLYQLRGNNETK